MSKQKNHNVYIQNPNRGTKGTNKIYDKNQGKLGKQLNPNQKKIIKKNKMNLKERMEKILEELKKDLYERDDIISVSLLSALAEQNIFLFGPPGTAKSLISRRLSKAFETDNYFEHLMQRFSTPEEVFGPVSISELKKDNYKRKTEGFLPEAEFAFLDEIWKSSPAILNTLLTIINEKVFKNGSEVKKVPLKVLISASNETPPDNQGLDALYDRFTTRLFVPPITERNNFEKILQNGSSMSEITISNNLIIKNDEWNEWKKLINVIKLSEDTLNIINAIKIEIDKLNKKDKKSIIYVSDRRWQKAALLLKASAFFCDRKETNIADCILLSHCLWTKEDNRKKIERIVVDAIKANGFQTGVSLLQLDKDKDQLEKEINKELFYSKDIYKTKKISGKEYFECRKDIKNRRNYNRNKERITFYIPVSKLKTTDEFHPMDENGNQYEWIKCNFDKQGVCSIQVNLDGRNNSYYLSNNYWENINSFTPPILFHKGDKKEDVNERLIDAFKKDIKKLKYTIKEILSTVQEKRKVFLQELETPFISDDKLKVTITSIDKQVEELSLRIKDCDRLKSLVE